jgi:putative ABC transport system substrate-binding protein
MRRRKFIAILGGAAAWPLAARAQQPGRMPRIGLLSVFAESDPEAQAWIRELMQGLQELGWSTVATSRSSFALSAGTQRACNFEPRLRLAARL